VDTWMTFAHYIRLVTMRAKTRTGHKQRARIIGTWLTADASYLASRRTLPLLAALVGPRRPKLKPSLASPKG
jgi:hypothetical protein